MFKNKFRSNSAASFLLLVILSCLIAGCAANTTSLKKAVKEDSKSKTVNRESAVAKTEKREVSKATAERSKGAMIKIKENSPADTIRVFYKRLRERKFHDAITLTNLRPAIEGLTDAEIKDLGVDFSFLAQSIPENMPINGEIITGDTALVTVNMVNEDTNRLEVQEIRLRKEKDNWTVLIADEKGEKRARKEGKNYFFALRMDVHHDEAKAMLDRIGKAQMIYSMSGGKFTDLKTLIKKGFVPQDAGSSVTTGYNYKVVLASNENTYTALATPAVYGKTGKLSFALKITTDKQPELVSRNLKGEPFLK